MNHVEPGCVRADQLIYTNVEADLSPTRQRGFQVWLCTPTLSAEQRREIARRLDNFRLPVGATAADDSLARHTYFRTTDSLFVIARSAPLAGKDKFGRGGRFHSHALVLSEAEFSRAGSNPFRVLDGGFPFHSTPEDAMTADNWQTGALPPTDVRLAIHPAEEATIPTDRLVAITDHLERDGDRTLMLPSHPSVALAAFRSLFVALPPGLRQRVNFDTLWTGDPGGQLKCHLAGGYSADNVRTWVSRRYVRLSLPAWDAQPPFEPSARPLPAALLAVNEWNDLTDADRDAAYRIGRALATGRMERRDITDVGPAAIAALKSCASTHVTILDAIGSRVATDVDPDVARLPRVQEAVQQYFNRPLEEQLARLCQPIPPELTRDEVRATLLDPTCVPAPELIAMAASWTEQPDPQIRLALAWWRGSEPDFAGLEQTVANLHPNSTELTELHHQASRLIGHEFTYFGDDYAGLIAELQLDREVSPEEIRRARLISAVTNGKPTQGLTHLRLLIDYHTDPSRLVGCLHDAARIFPHSVLFDLIFRNLRVQMLPGWEAGLPDECLLGLKLHPETPQDCELLNFIMNEEPRYIRPLIYRLVPQAYPKRPDARKEMGETSAITNSTRDLFKKVLEAQPHAVKAATEALAGHLKKRSPMEFQHGVNEFFISKVKQGDPCLRWNELSSDFTIGFKLSWSVGNSRDRYPDLFRAVAGSVVAGFDHGPMPEGPLPARFVWLIARIADGTHTGHWTVDQD